MTTAATETAAAGTLRIERLGEGRARARDWLQAKHAAHEGQAAYVAPLSLFEKRRLTPKHNPFFELGDAAFFVAFRGEKPVGRISAQIHHPGLANAPPELGHFGFFDVTNDEQAAHALLDAAAAWVLARGATRLRGPFSLSINEECGCQIDDFDTPTSYLMPQARPWTGRFLETWGLAKCMDMHTWRVTWEKAQERIAAYEGSGSSLLSITSRPVRMSHFTEDVRLLADIFNDAWSENWGFVPFSPRAVELLAAELRMIYRASYGCFVEHEGAPVGVFISVPNINELIQPMRGRLTPFSAIRLGWKLWSEGAETLRVPIAGIRKSHQSGLQGALLTAALMRSVIREAKRKPKKWYELSWVLETNKPAISALRLMGAERTTTHRIYEKALA
ncbi:MAG: hypothetical protein ACRCTI_21530 [Beijerinckiaceae bacterium]